MTIICLSFRRTMICATLGTHWSIVGELRDTYVAGLQAADNHTVMIQIRDLPAPVTASKADWQSATNWIGFTPSEDSLSARNQCQSTIQRQFGPGYVIEYITKTLSEPNAGFEQHPDYLRERELHKATAGRLIAVHRLRTTARRLETILGGEQFGRLQDMWAVGDKRCRWSVAFPIVESYVITGTPFADKVFTREDYEQLYQRPSAVLRLLSDRQRAAIANLSLEPVPALNAWIGIEDEFVLAEGSDINPATLRAISQDLSDAALEGQPIERRAKLRLRAAWLADRFALLRQRTNLLVCDNCKFDPASRSELASLRPRSLFDVHHKNPLDEGIRYTTVADFALLCPTCHRIEHRLGDLRRRTAGAQLTGVAS